MVVSDSHCFVAVGARLATRWSCPIVLADAARLVRSVKDAQLRNIPADTVDTERTLQAAVGFVEAEKETAAVGSAAAPSFAVAAALVLPV
jgi:HD-like signal output (HDOD) protein